MGVRKPGDPLRPTDDEALPEDSDTSVSDLRRPVQSTMVFSELDNPSTDATEGSGVSVRGPGVSLWSASQHEVDEIGPPLLMEDIPEPTVGDEVSGSNALFPETDPWAGFAVKPVRRPSPPTIIPDPDESEETAPMSIPPYGVQLPSGVSAGREPEMRRQRDAGRPAPADLATLLARTGAVPRPKPTPPAQYAEGPTLDDTGGTGVRWLIVVLVLAVVAAVAGAAITLVLQGSSGRGVVLPPAEQPAARDTLLPSAEDDPTAGRTPPEGRSFVRFVSEPAGAVVRVDGDFVGRTPTTADLALGSHEIVMSLEGHAGYSKTVDVTEPRKRVEASLGQGPQRGPASIIAEGMDGARLWIDGRSSGVIPAQVTLTPGLHRFKMVGPNGTIEVEREVWVLDGATVQLDLTAK